MNLSVQLANHINTWRRRVLPNRACQADTWDPLSLVAAVRSYVDYVRQDSRPLFLQVDTYRLMAPSKGDDDRSQALI